MVLKDQIDGGNCDLKLIEEIAGCWWIRIGARVGNSAITAAWGERYWKMILKDAIELYILRWPGSVL